MNDPVVDPAANEAETPPVTEPAETTTPANEEAADDPIKRITRKLERRIDTRTRALGQRDARIAQLERELSEARVPVQTVEEVEPRDVVPREAVEERARQLAEDRLYRDEIADRTTKMLEAGKAFEGFKDKAQDVAEDIPFLDRNRRPTPFIEALLDTDHPADLMVRIHEDDELREELAGIANQPRKLARRLALLEVELRKKPEKRSGASKPLEPINGGGGSSRDESKMTDAEWREAHRKRRA